MADYFALYVSNRDLLSNARIRHAVEGFKVQFFAEDEGHTEHPNWVWFSIRWPEGNAKIERICNRRPDMSAQLVEVCDFINAAPNGKDDLRRRLLDKVLRTRNLLKMTAPPECADRLAAFAGAMASESNALLFYDAALWDPNGRLCLNAESEHDPEAEWQTLPSALERKAASEARLRSLGIPVQESLPPIEANEEGQIRPPWEVARRASALVTVAARAEGLEQQRAIQFLQAWGIWDAASPREQAYLLNPVPTEAERIQCLWRYECLWVMLWVLGHVEDLGLAICVCDVRHAVKTVTGTPTDVFIGKSNLRPMEQILDEADFIYRCDWAVKNAQTNGEPIPAGLDPGVVTERHIALNWLRSYHSKHWDDVTPNI